MTVPVAVKVAEITSDDPIAVDLIEKEPLTLRVPVAPAYFPVPLKIFAFPLMEIVVGAFASSAHPWAEVSNANLRVLPPPERVPEPSKPSHWFIGAE